MQASDGRFYGTTSGGGTAGNGVVFRVTPGGSVTILHAFAGGTADGAVPESALLEGRDGKFYGMTSLGGEFGWGTVYRMTPEGVVTILHSLYAFDGDHGQLSVRGSLIRATDGSLYGLSPAGGGSRPDRVQIFRISGGRFAVLYEFEGYLHTGSLIQARDGHFYGSTATTVFRFSRSGSFRVLHTFNYLSDTADGSFPNGVVQGNDGYLYGTTLGGGSREGGGVVFRMGATAPQMALDLPRAQQTLAPPFLVSGWVLDQAASTGTGVDTLHVWAYPVGGGSSVFLGVASYGLARPDVGAIYGDRFTATGFSLRVRNLSPGRYRIVSFAHSTLINAFDATRSVTVTVGNQETRSTAAIDLPAPATQVGATFIVAGWAIDAGSSDDAGVDAVHVYAYPAAGGAPIFLGVASLGISRPDVAARWGPQFATAGYSLSAGGLAPGAYRLAVYAHSTITGTFTPQVRDIVVRPPGDPHMAVDGPASGTRVRVPFAVAGWAIDCDAPTETGVDAIHIWAFPASGGAAIFLGVATSAGSRPDVGAAFGPQFTASGYGLNVSHLSPGRYQIVVYVHSSVTRTFNQTRAVPVTVF